MSAASSSTVGVSSKLPNARGCELASIRTGSGRGETGSGTGSLSTVGAFTNEAAGGLFARTTDAGPERGEIISAARGGAAGVPAAVIDTPARASADFTIQINGSGG